jgi:hypothetical protein
METWRAGLYGGHVHISVSRPHAEGPFSVRERASGLGDVFTFEADLGERGLAGVAAAG